MIILTLNAGSSSIKYKLFNQEDHQLIPVISGLMEGIGESTGNWRHQFNQENDIQQELRDHQQAFELLADRLREDLSGQCPDIIGHRVVHGGEDFSQPTVITSEVLHKLHALIPLAPLHNPVNIAGIEAARKCFKDALQVAVFDTGFHQTMPEKAYQYAIDRNVAAQNQIRRYGFHGINHHFVGLKAAEYLQKPFSDCQFITLHLGNGASGCLIKNGQSHDTSMGMTPLAGLVMGSRCGDIDPSIPLYLQRKGFSLDEIEHLLNKNSGLIGLADDNDMRRLTERAEQGDRLASMAIELFVYSVQKLIGAYYSQTDKLDALIFTGGIGENASLIRQKIIEPLSHMGFKLDEKQNMTRSKARCYSISSASIPVMVIKGDEELFIAELCTKVNA